MKTVLNIGEIAIFVVTGWAGLATLTVPARANDGVDGRFAAIEARNVFGLKEPPPLPPPLPLPAPATTVKITGITTIVLPKRAILQVQVQGQKSESIVLCEGESFGAVQVHGIDVDNGEVTIFNDGQPMKLSLEKNGVAIPVGPAPVDNHVSLAALENRARSAASGSHGPRPPIEYAGVVTLEGRSVKLAGTNTHSGILESTAENYGTPPVFSPDSQVSPADLLRRKIERMRLERLNSAATGTTATKPEPED